jgi:hypothetical protein
MTNISEDQSGGSLEAAAYICQNQHIPTAIASIKTNIQATCEASL